jgi:hypothetical protein
LFFLTVVHWLFIDETQGVITDDYEIEDNTDPGSKMAATLCELPEIRSALPDPMVLAPFIGQLNDGKLNEISFFERKKIVETMMTISLANIMVNRMGCKLFEGADRNNIVDLSTRLIGSRQGPLAETINEMTDEMVDEQ